MAGDASRKNGLLGGRPTKLTEEVVLAAEEYVEDCFTGLDEIVVKEGFKDGETSFEQKAPRLPNLYRLALRCKISSVTLWEWEKPNGGKEAEDDAETAALRSRFTKAASCIRDLQAAMLNEEGSAGRLNPKIAALILSAKHGYHEKRELMGEGGGPIKIEAVKGFNLLPPKEDAA